LIKFDFCKHSREVGPRMFIKMTKNYLIFDNYFGSI
jgi:hypothetical protein